MMVFGSYDGLPLPYGSYDGLPLPCGSYDGLPLPYGYIPYKWPAILSSPGRHDELVPIREYNYVAVYIHPLHTYTTPVCRAFAERSYSALLWRHGIMTIGIGVVLCRRWSLVDQTGHFSG